MSNLRWRSLVAVALVGVLCGSGTRSADAQGRDASERDRAQLTTQDAMRVLTEANELLREGHLGAAARKFERALAMGEGTPLAAYAQLGLAWTEVARGDLVAAEVLLEDAVPVAGDASPGAAILLGLLHGSGGRTAEARRLLDGVVERTRRTDLRASALLARGYVRYWAGDFMGAVAEFDEAAGARGIPELSDDARYGAAWARWKAGDRAAAEAALRALAATEVDGPAPPRIGWPLVDLRSKVVLSDAVARYRRAGLARPGRAIVVLLDADGAARAARALRGLAQPDLPSIFLAPMDAPARLDVETQRPSQLEPEAPAPAPASAGSDARPAARAPSESGSGWWVVASFVLALTLLSIAIVRRRRR